MVTILTEIVFDRMNTVNLQYVMTAHIYDQQKFNI